MTPNMDTPKPSEEQIEVAKKLDVMARQVAPKVARQNWIADFLAARDARRDAEKERPWREAVINAQSWFESSRVHHFRDCASPHGKCNCGVQGMIDAFIALLSPSHPSPAPNKGESR